MEISPFLVRLLPVLSALAVASVVEALVPLRKQSRRASGRLATNLWLLAITLALGILLNFTLALGAAYFAESGVGLLHVLGIGGVAAFVVALLALDGATYVVHRLMHQTPILWRVHLVHHIDASVDATTAFRQHPIEGVLRFSFIAATAWGLGAPPAAIAVYRLLGALNSVLEHANIHVPRWLDRIAVLVWVTPDMHKVHHSRDRIETDSNYANLFSFFDRLFGSFTPSSRGPLVRYGINGYDTPEQQSIGAVLLLPFRGLNLRAVAAVVAAVALMLACLALRAEEATPKQVLFVCEHGNVKSLMAASYFNQLAAKRGLRVQAISRGSVPDSTIVPAPIVAGLRMDGVDVGSFKPAAVSAADVAGSERVVVISTALPSGIDAPAAKVDHWDDVPAASVNYAAARDSLRAHIEQLLDRM